MKKKLKVFFIYLGVIVLSLVSTALVCGAFLFFYREGNIFGIQYISRDEVIFANTEDFGIGDIDGINIETGAFDIKIRAGSNDYVGGAMVNKAFGYVHKSKAQASFSATFDKTEGILTFNVVEPQGWTSKKDCYIAIAIPKGLIDRGVNINVRSDKGGISVGGGEQISVNDINIQNSKGETTLTNINIKGDIDLDIGSGLIFIDEKCEGQDVDINIKLGSGEVDLTTVEKLDIKALIVEKIKSGLVRVLKADEVSTDGNIQGGGKIEIGQALELDISTLDTDIKVGTIGEIGSEGALTSRIDILGNGDVEIFRAYSAVQITGHNGDVKVGEITGDIALTTNQGDIEVADAYKSVSVDTQYGTAKINFSDNAGQYSAGGRILIAGTKNGHIISSGVQNANVTIVDKGRATLDYDVVRGSNAIIAEKIGSIDIVVPHKKESGESVAIDLETKSETKPDIKIGTVSSQQAGINNGNYILEVDNIYGSAGTNVLRVETATGNIKIRSRDLINF